MENLKDEINASYAEKKSYGDNILLTISENEPVYKALTIRVWVEGNDRETISPLLGGMFDIKLSFVGIEKQINIKTLNITKQDNTLIGLTNEMEYQIDNGKWITYNNQTLQFNNQTVKVRYLETEKYFPSESIIFEF